MQYCQLEVMHQRRGLTRCICRRCRVQYVFGQWPVAFHAPCRPTQIQYLPAPSLWAALLVTALARWQLYRRLAMSLWLALYDWRAAGYPGVSRADSYHRDRACQACPHQHLLWGVLERCGACGCLLDVKRRMGTEGCPLRRWPGDEQRKPCRTCQQPPLLLDAVRTAGSTKAASPVA